MKRFMIGSALCGTLAAFPCIANAQATDMTEAEAQNDNGVIIVTAQKREENIQEVPIAITAIGSDYLEERGVQSIEDLGAVAPNVKFERAPSSKTISQIAIRGSVTINPAITWEPAVGLYVDGVYIAKAQGSIFDIADLERVEILRGPQGTLYGRNALAGAVNLVTAKPSGEAGGRAEVTYGSFNQWKFKGVLDLPQMGMFSAKLSGQYERRDGVVDIVPNPVPGVATALPNQVDETDTVRNGSFMVQLRAEPTDNLTVDYTYDYSKQNQDPPFAQLYRVNRNGDPRDIFDPASPGYAFGGAIFPLDRYTSTERLDTASIDAPVYEKSRSYGHALTLTADMGDVTLKSITAYRNLAWSDGIDLDGSPLPVAFTQRITDYDAFSQELQLTGLAFNDRLAYVLGAFYFDESAETNNPQVFFGGGSDYDSRYGSGTKAWALYAQMDFNITDALKLTLGGRYTHEKKDIMRYLKINYDAAGGIFTPTVIADIDYGDIPDAKYNDFSPAITLGYQVTPEINLYARYAKGFKSGGFNGETNVFYDPAALAAGCPFGAAELCDPYKPEKVNSYEIGFKSQLFDNRLTINLAGFYDDHKDIQLAIFTAAGAASSVVRNAASAEIKGLEFEMLARPSDAFTLNGSLALLDAKYKSYIDAGVEVSDNRAFSHTPSVSGSIGFDWRVLEQDWGQLNLYGDLSYVSEYYTYPYPLRTPTASDQRAGNSQSQGRTIVNLRATVSQIRLGGAELSISGFVRNLLKEDHPANFIDFGPGFGGLTAAYFPDPRTWGVSMGVEF
ncbi:MAG: TonB-dependent receptor [Sphingomonadaceae bacterium]